MGTLSEEGGDGGFSVWKRRIFICRKVHVISSDLPLYRSDAKLGPARKFAVDSVSNAPGSAACLCGSPARCNCCLESYDPVLLILYVELGELTKFFLVKTCFPRVYPPQTFPPALQCGCPQETCCGGTRIACHGE
jgi:hypothetical protein